MGYYINLTDSNANIPAENLDEALTRLKALNHKPGVHKNGGRWPKTGSPLDDWFSWMPADYDQTVESVEDVFKLLGFECESNPDDGLTIYGYDSKIGQEQLFIDEVADLFTDGSYMVWRGEDSEIWRWSKEHGVQHGTTIFAPTEDDLSVWTLTGYSDATKKGAYIVTAIEVACKQGATLTAGEYRGVLHEGGTRGTYFAQGAEFTGPKDVIHALSTMVKLVTE